MMRQLCKSLCEKYFRTGEGACDKVGFNVGINMVNPEKADGKKVEGEYQ
jgi:hypothetical protein